MTPDEVSRRYRAAAKAVSDDLGRAVWSTLGRALPILIAVIFVAGVVAGNFGITEEIGEGEPFATIAAAGALVVTLAAIFGFSLWRVLGGPRGEVLDVIAWTAQEAQREWTAASPGSTVPRSPTQARRWLAGHPETEANRPQRLAAALMAGDLAGARETLGRYPVGTAFERHQRAADGLGVDLVSGRTLIAGEIGAAYVDLGSEHLEHAITCRALTEAFAAVLSDGDWRAPLVRARRDLPPEAAGLGRRQAWLLLVGAIVGTCGLLVGATAAVWLLTR
jgi:hypothetical protein